MKIVKSAVTILLFLGLAATASSQSADAKLKEIAAAYCACMTDTTSSLSDTAKQLVIRAGDSDDPKNALLTWLGKLTEDLKASVAEEFINISASPMGICLTETDKKYMNETTGDKKVFIENLINALKAKQGCKLAAAFMQLGKQELNEE